MHFQAFIKGIEKKNIVAHSEQQNDMNVKSSSIVLTQKSVILISERQNL